MSIYPRPITIKRPASTLSSTGGKAIAQPSQKGGVMPYSGQNQTPATGASPGEDTLFTGLPASIQSKGGGATTDTIPSGAPGPMRWKIYVPKSALQPPGIKNKDVVIDDEGQRYQVVSNYWNLLGYTLETIRLEA